MPFCKALCPSEPRSRLPAFLGCLALQLLSSSPLSAQITSLEDLQQRLTAQNSTLLTAPAPDAAKESVNPNVFYASPGPWGRLRCAYIFLEAPKNLIENFPLPNTMPRWTFPESMRADLPAFFQRAGLSEAVIQTILDPKTAVYVLYVQ